MSTTEAIHVERQRLHNPSYEDVRHLLIRAAGQVAVQFGHGRSAGYYRWRDRSLPEVCVWCREPKGWTVLDAGYAMIHDDVEKKAAYRVPIQETPYMEADHA